jgi:hypothetical protein
MINFPGGLVVPDSYSYRKLDKIRELEQRRPAAADRRETGFGDASAPCRAVPVLRLA